MQSFQETRRPWTYPCINEEVLQSYSGLFVVKSISKSYGVPGIRLGVLASSDEAAIALLKKEAPIWNINSFGEFFMQNSEKYKKDYRESLKKLGCRPKRANKGVKLCFISPADPFSGQLCDV